MSLLTLERHLRRAGYYLETINASHRHYRNQQNRLLVVSVHGSRVRPDIARKARCAVRRAGGAL